MHFTIRDRPESRRHKCVYWKTKEVNNKLLCRWLLRSQSVLHALWWGYYHLRNDNEEAGLLVLNMMVSLTGKYPQQVTVTSHNVDNK